MAIYKRKPIKLRYGGLKIVADIMGVSEQTVRRALKFEYDTIGAERIRRKAIEMNLVKSNRMKI